MLQGIKSFALNVLCEDDAHTQIDPFVLGTAIALLTFVALAAYSVIGSADHHFNFQDFGTGSGTILGGGGLGKFAKAKGDAAK